MKNQHRKERKWIIAVIVVIVVCTSSRKEKDERKIMATTIINGYVNDYWNNEVQLSDSRIFGIWDECKTQIEMLTENNVETAKTDGENTEDDAETAGIDEENADDKWNVDYEVVTDSYIFAEQRNDIDIYYPQLQGFTDSAKEERINALIEKDVKKIIGEKNKDGDDTLYCISLDYEIKFLNERIISILYTGMYGYMTPGRGLNGEAIATTIDMEEEKVITIKDVVTDFTELRDMLLADEFEHITKWEGQSGGYQVSWDYRGGFEYELEEDLRKEQKWYTDGNNFIVITKGLADYNEYSISNDAARHILNEVFLKKLE